MKILLDGNNKILAYAAVGDITGSIDVQKNLYDTGSATVSEELLYEDVKDYHSVQVVPSDFKEKFKPLFFEYKDGVIVENSEYFEEEKVEEYGQSQPRLDLLEGAVIEMMDMLSSLLMSNEPQVINEEP